MTVNRPECDAAGVLTYKQKNQAGQVMTLIITPEEYDNLIYWTVVFWINKRRTGYVYLNQTGKCGLYGLLWAKGCIADFIEKNDGHGKAQHLVISWDNGRRRDAYVRGLSDLGFKIKRIERRLWLHKLIEDKVAK